MPIRRPRRTFLAGGSAFALHGVAGHANAGADWPTKPIQLVIGYPTGGVTDGVTRPLDVPMQKALGQPLIFDYRPGAGATIAAAYVARARPDGHVLHIADNGPMTILPHGERLPYDPLVDLTPIGLVAEGPTIICVSSGVQAESLGDLVEIARRRPAEILFGVSGRGGAPQLAGEMFQEVAGIRLRSLPYKGGSQVAIDLAGGQIPMAFASPGAILPFVKTGKIRLLAVTSRTRLPLFPDIPTVAESGYPDYHVTTWFGLVGPAGLGETIVARASDALQKALGRPEVIAAIQSVGYEPLPGTPQHFRDRIAADFARWGKLVRERNIQF